MKKSYPKPYKWKPKKREKYKGNIDEIWVRSSWELKFMNWCDRNDAVLEWGSEVAVIPYVSPIDKKVHRYFVDFYMKIKDTQGNVKKYLIEIKPKRFTQEPVKPKKMSKQFIQEVYTYSVNQAKWKAAKEFCADRGFEFLILTEEELKV